MPSNSASPRSNSVPSNTLILSGFSRSDFPAKAAFSSESNGIAPSTSPADLCLTSELRALLSDANNIPIVHWGNLKSFGRVIVVFQSAQDAMKARLVLQTKEYTNLKAHFDKHTPIFEIESEDNHLKLPDKGRLFFISPPPSPPAGWVSQPEASPNTETFHSDLSHALLNLSHADSSIESLGDKNAFVDSPSVTSLPSETIVSPATGRLVHRVTLHEPSPALSVLSLKTEDSSLLRPIKSPGHTSSPAAMALPMIVVEWDEDGDVVDSSNSNNSTHDKMRPTRTERPPML